MGADPREPDPREPCHDEPAPTEPDPPAVWVCARRSTAPPPVTVPSASEVPVEGFTTDCPDRLLLTLPRGMGRRARASNNRVVVRVRWYRSYPFVDIRHLYDDPMTGETRATRKGTTIRRAEIDATLTALVQARKIMLGSAGPWPDIDLPPGTEGCVAAADGGAEDGPSDLGGVD